MFLNRSSLLLAITLLASTVSAEDSLPKQAYEILKARCYRCHGGSARQAGIDVLSRENLLELRGDVDAKFAFIVPGDATNSQLLDTIEPGDSSYMPKVGSPEAKAMTDAEKQLLRDWVVQGAEFPRIESRPFITETQILAAMREYLLSVNADDRRNIRFLTLTHLQNNPRVSEFDMRLYRAALAKALNSLTRQQDVYQPVALPATGNSVYAVDLRRLGWDRFNRWDDILAFYPYALKFDFVADEQKKQIWKDVAQFSGADVPYIRADWLVVNATQPPLYHRLLEIPETLSELEQELKLDIRQNFLKGRLQRSGFAKSGVSRQNRLLERHTTPVSPYVWLSYDFKPRKTEGDLFRFPLGPKFEGNPHNNQAFSHDGGELIWSLPNGMQAYMLVDNEGNRIDSGPVDVVFDRSAVLGTPAIINGISCMYCHRDGLITNFRDELRTGDFLGGFALEHMRRLYPRHEQIEKSTQADQKIFRLALEQVVGPYLQVGEDMDRPISRFPEPIGKVAEMYARDLTPQELALELGFDKIETLQSKIEANPNLLRFGLGTMVQDPPGTLKREKWETQDGTSLMQDVASQLRLGLPFVPSSPRN